MHFLTGIKKSACKGSAVITCMVLLSGYSYSQNKPGIDGMAPARWITLRHTQAPGRSYRSVGSNDQVCTQEDIYFKFWLPVVHRPKFSMAIGPQYRTEQLEFEGNKENPASSLSHWNLRYAGADIRSMISLDSSTWLMLNINGNKSGNFGDYSIEKYPLNYTVSAAYVKKKSNNKEFGIGLLVNNSFTGITVLPIIIYHYNFSKKTAIEINLPYKMAWRYIVTNVDILFLKAEAQNRNYLVRLQDEQCSFRSINLDLGIAYNRTFSKLIGAEAFIGYRQNLSNRLPEDVIAVKKSGMAFSLEIYVRPPLKK